MPSSKLSGGWDTEGALKGEELDPVFVFPQDYEESWYPSHQKASRNYVQRPPPIDSTRYRYQYARDDIPSADEYYRTQKQPEQPQRPKLSPLSPSSHNPGTMSIPSAVIASGYDYTDLYNYEGSKIKHTKATSSNIARNKRSAEKKKYGRNGDTFNKMLEEGRISQDRIAIHDREEKESGCCSVIHLSFTWVLLNTCQFYIMPPVSIQKSKLANKPAPNDRTIKRSWLHAELHFQLPERIRKKSSKPQEKPSEALWHEVAAPHSNFIAEPRKTPSRTEESQNFGSPDKEPNWIAYMARGGYLESPQEEPTRNREPPPIRLLQEIRQSYSQTQDFQDLPPPPDLTLSKEQADYYDSLSLEMRKTYGYPLLAKSSEFKIPRKPLEKYEYRLDEKIKVEIGKKPKFVRPQIRDIPPQANSPKPHSRAKTCSSRSSICPRSPRTPSTMNSEGHKREFSDLEHFRPRKEHQKSQRIIKETKHARPQTVTASEVQRYKSIAGSIHHEPSRRSSMQFSEVSHSRPRSSRMHSPAERFQAQQNLNLEMYADQYDRLEAQDRQIEEHRRSSARSHRPPIPITTKPSENISQLETRYLPRIPITHLSHQPAAIPIHSSARPYRPRAPNIPRPSENTSQSGTGYLPRFPISHHSTAIPHQPSSSSRPHRPPTPLIPKPPENTNQLEARSSRPVPNTLQRRRGRPLKPPQPRSDRVKPRLPVPSSGKEGEKKRRWWKT
ncbi:hypothetical protein BCON_0111g00210 [Botryotinia convoluta]|uniref:Uncharacterized protein n=1 Tax=Botryotinia convoluta TaxID=54673 RepID=A0A4Z1HY46_9HELO|nr:hypothetical protein BCON_0111g00210 [Botryotinia convoluta]